MTQNNMTHSSDMKWAEGYWLIIHFTAAWATSESKFKFFCEWFRMIIATLPCLKCRQHAAEYAAAHPPEESDDAFYYTWEFHNTVSRRIGKPEMSYSTAAQMYLGNGMAPCTTCGH